LSLIIYHSLGARGESELELCCPLLSTKAPYPGFLALQLAVTPSINSLTDYGAAAAKIKILLAVDNAAKGHIVYL